MKTINRRNLGNTGESVTEISLGAMNLRTLDTEAEGIAMIHKVLDKGINLIDTARAYKEVKPDGRIIESEILVNKALNSYSGLNEPILIITKGHGYEIEAFDADLKTSLNKLGVSGQGDLYIGDHRIKLVYFFHGINEERWTTMKKSGVLDHAKKLQEQGLFTYLGFSSHTGHEVHIEEAVNSGYFQVTELPYNVFAPGMESLMKLASEKGMGVINMKAFGGNGMVTKSELFKDYCNITTDMRLQFCLSSPYIASVDVGCRFEYELEEDIEVAHRPKLSMEQCSELIDEAKRVGESTQNTCRECTHCLEKFQCPQGIDFPKILAIHTRYKIAKEFKQPIQPIREMYHDVKVEAEKCVSCNLCLPWCEYDLDIPKLLIDVNELLGSEQ